MTDVTHIVASNPQDTVAVGNPLKSIVEAWGKVKITERTNNITGHDSVKLLMAEGTTRLWAADHSIFVLCRR